MEIKQIGENYEAIFDERWFLKYSILCAVYTDG